MNDQEIAANIDLRGVKPQLNYIRILVQLDKLKSGQILEAMVDYGEALSEVEKKIKEEGHHIVSIEEYGETNRVLIRKA